MRAIVEEAGKRIFRLQAEGFYEGGGVGRNEFWLFSGSGEGAIGVFEAVSGHGSGDKAAFGDAAVADTLDKAG